jgi:SAM-dependent methyltransferase
MSKYLTGDSSVLDVGAGVGIWAIRAAKLGARRVVAVEMDECLIPLLRKHAEENGVADRIEIVHGDITKTDLNEKFDLIIGEVFGATVFGESTIKTFMNMRDRFLAPGGAVMPQRMRMMAAPVLRSENVRDQMVDVGVTFDFMQSLLMNYYTNLGMGQREALRFAAEPQCLVEVDYQTVTEPATGGLMFAEWNIPELSQVDSIVTFTLVDYAPGVQLNSLDSIAWAAENYRFIPFKATAGRLSFSLSIDEKGSSWTIAAPSHRDLRPQTYSPIFAFTRAKMA